ncbi:MAG TPA: hypothetical protein VE422_04610 [Terriglobia bacterium]|nr:hypothetical protein [Terriglobia bacterium]
MRKHRFSFPDVMARSLPRGIRKAETAVDRASMNIRAAGFFVSFRQDCMTYLEGHQAYEGVLCAPRTM